MPALSTTATRQLALIKYMFQQGVEQSRRPSPLFVMALLNFQDAAELFLHLACEHHGVTVPKQSQFLDYWKLLDSVGPVRHQPGMDRLNRARVNFKHHGNLPNEQDMEFFRVTAQSFFEENSTILFGTSLQDVSLIDLVTCSEARKQLEEAEKQWNAKRTEALARAFVELTADYGQRKRTQYSSRDPFTFGPSMAFQSSFSIKTDSDRLNKFIDATKDSIEAMQTAMRLLAFGLDYRKYARFQMLTPFVTRTLGGGMVINRWDRPAMTKDEYDFCLAFVIESAIKLQDFDYTV